MSDISPERFKEVIVNGEGKLQLWILPEGPALALTYENEDSLVELVYPLDRDDVLGLAQALAASVLDPGPEPMVV